MNPITIVDLGIAILFFISAITFHLLKEKGAMLVSGFDAIPESEKKNYDKKRISFDMRNSLLIWGTILLIGSILSQFIHEYFGIGAMVIFFILVINSIGSFDKYKKN